MKLIDYLEKFERKFSQLSMAIILSLLGVKAAGKYLSYSPIVRRTKARILWLHKRILERKGQDAADRFAIDYLSARPRPQDYSTILVGTGTNRLSTDKLSASLATITKIARNQDATYAMLTVALFERGENDLIGEYIKDMPVDLPEGWYLTLLSLVPRPLSETISHSRDALVWKNMQLPPCKNRLIIMDEILSPETIRNLANGAEKLTLLQYKDLYGNINLDTIQAILPSCPITVEHARSRVDRFHQRYFELHQKTLEAAKTLTQDFIQKTPWLKEYVPGSKNLNQDLTLELADKLFFKALRLESVYQAALDPSFDSVVVSFGEGFELYRLFFSDTTLWQDSRIMGCCRSSKMKTVRRYASRISEMQRRARVGSTHPILERIASQKERGRAGFGQSPPPQVSRYLKIASEVPACTRPSHLSDHQTVAFITQDGRAYGSVAIQMATHLHARFNVDIIFTHGSANELHHALASAQNDPYLKHEEKGRLPGSLKWRAAISSETASKAFSSQFDVSLGNTIQELLWKNWQDHSVSSAIDFLLSEGLSQSILSVLATSCAIAALLQRERYAAIVISPIRTPRNIQFATLAREAGIPTIAVEPHCLNAAYCRYGTVPTDYAAVYSDYYAQEYDRYFGIPKDRCYSFGSPRVLRPIGYDPIASRQNARQQIGLHAGDPPVIAVPTQPMPADHILVVWRMIIRAAKSLYMPVRILLKPHPEEGPGHVERYRQIIEEENAANFCFVINADIKDLVIASDLVLTAYSVTALEAVVLERNVAIVGKTGVAYPMEYDKILGIPFCTTVEEIRDTIIEAMSLGRNARSGAKDFIAANPHLLDNSTFDCLAGILEDVIAKGSGGIRRHEDLPSSLFVTAPFQEYLV
ncbi:MAG: hypothetical protein FWC56_02000 [Phycisphaerae bacterium]|nr:hypothetical protein [Phycisphaerae bacterium]